MAYDSERGWVREYLWEYDRDNVNGRRTRRSRTFMAVSMSDAIKQSNEWQGGKSGFNWSSYTQRITCVGSGEYLEWVFEGGRWTKTKDTLRRLHLIDEAAPA